MKLKRRVVLLFALVAVVAISAQVLRSRGAWHAWRPLLGGGEVRVLAVTHGSQHAIERPGPSWRERLRAARRARSFGPLTLRPQLPMRTTTKTPSLVFWIEVRNLPRSWQVLGPSADLLLPDGQAFEDGTVGFMGNTPTTVLDVQFPILPARSRTVRLITRGSGGRQEFTVPNPAYRTDLPRWKPDPAPPTKRHGEAEFTLRGVNIFAMESAKVRTDALLLWRAEPLWAITHRGVRGESFYLIDAVFEDSAGNVLRESGLFSEPVWKVRATITRSDLFPFVESEVRWIDTIDPALPEAQTPQAFALLPLAAERSGGRFKLVGVFAPGQFEIQHAAVIAVALPESAEEHAGIAWDGTRGVHTVRLKHPAALIVEDLSASRDREPETQIFCVEEGSAIRLKERWGSTVNRWSLRVYDLPAQPVRLGLAKNPPFTLESLINAPEPPRSRNAPRQ